VAGPSRTAHNKKKPGVMAYRYQAKAEDCHACAYKPKGCPGNQQRGRGLLGLEESAAVLAFRKKMASEEAPTQYLLEWVSSQLRNCRGGYQQFPFRSAPQSPCYGSLSITRSCSPKNCPVLLSATFTRLPASVANKRLTCSLNPLNATFTRNRGLHPSSQISPLFPNSVATIG
jgi:hypothetical protein